MVSRKRRTGQGASNFSSSVTTATHSSAFGLWHRRTGVGRLATVDFDLRDVGALESFDDDDVGAVEVAPGQGEGSVSSGPARRPRACSAPRSIPSAFPLMEEPVAFTPAAGWSTSAGWEPCLIPITRRPLRTYSLASATASAGLPGVLLPDYRDDAGLCHRASASARSSAVLMLKKMRSGSPAGESGRGRGYRLSRDHGSRPPGGLPNRGSRRWRHGRPARTPRRAVPAPWGRCFRAGRHRSLQPLGQCGEQTGGNEGHVPGDADHWSRSKLDGG
jgi:hypothetical protein